MSSDDAPTLTDKQVYAKGLAFMVLQHIYGDGETGEFDYDEDTKKRIERAFEIAYEQGEKHARKQEK